MAEREVRVKVQLEYPPVTVPESRLIWMLVQREQCRTVADLCGLIRDKFYPYQRGALRLYVQDCLLPPGESSAVVRDGDLIRVVFDSYCPEDEEIDGHSHAPPTKKRKKRHRQNVEEDQDEEGSYSLLKPKRPKHQPEDWSGRKSWKEKKKKKRWEGASPEKRDQEGSPESLRKSLSKRPLIPDEESSEGSVNKVIPEKRRSEASSKRKKLKKQKVVTENCDSGDSSKVPRKKDSSIKHKTSQGSSSMEKANEQMTSPKANSDPQHEKLRVNNRSGNTEPSNAASKGLSLDPDKPTTSVSVIKTKHNRSLTPQARNLTPESRGDASVSLSDPEPSSATKKPSEVANNTISSGSVTKTLNLSSRPQEREETSSSSPSSMSSDDDAKKTGLHLSNAPKKTHDAESSSTSDSDNLIIRKTVVTQRVPSVPFSVPGGGGQQGPMTKAEAFGHGRGQVRDSPPGMGQRGRGFRGRGDQRNQGRGRWITNHFFYNHELQKKEQQLKEQQLEEQQLKEQQLEEPATNVSIIIQNPPEPQRRDYSELPLLAAPPMVGKVMAFKLLELTENYTPEVSEYKEGRLLGYDPATKNVELELLSHQKRKMPGKFDLVYECVDGRRVTEYAVAEDCKVTQHWSSLIEPRLLLESG